MVYFFSFNCIQQETWFRVPMVAAGSFILVFAAWLHQNLLNCGRKETQFPWRIPLVPQYFPRREIQLNRLQYSCRFDTFRHFVLKNVGLTAIREWATFQPLLAPWLGAFVQCATCFINAMVGLPSKAALLDFELACEVFSLWILESEKECWRAIIGHLLAGVSVM